MAVKKSAKKKTAKRKMVTKAIGRDTKTTLATRIEDAMTLALKICQAEGITDPGEIRIRINAAREQAAGS